MAAHLAIVGGCRAVVDGYSQADEIDGAAAALAQAPAARFAPRQQAMPVVLLI